MYPKLSKSFFTALCFIVLICNIIDNSAHAQQLRDERRQLELTVNDRVPEDLRPQGLTMGGMIVRPQLTLQGKYSNNVLAQSGNEKSDFSTTLKPSVIFLKQYQNHKFLFGGNVEIERFASQSAENNASGIGFFRGMLEGNSKWQFPFSLNYISKARQRSAPLSELASTERLQVNTLQGEAGVTRQFNRLSITLLGDYSNVKNEDGVAIFDGSPVVYSDDDRDRVGGKLKFRYVFPRGTATNDIEHTLFADLIYGTTDYKNRQFRNGSYSGPIGNNTEYGFLAGFETNYKGLLFANIGLGAIQKKYDDDSLKDISTYDLSADIAYNILPKLTLKGLVSRYIDQDSGFAQGLVTTNYEVGADYELLHNLYAGASLGLTTYDFETNNREDETFNSSIFVRYLHGRNFDSKLELRHENRSSNVVGNDFDRAEIVLFLNSKF